MVKACVAWISLHIGTVFFCLHVPRVFLSDGVLGWRRASVLPSGSPLVLDILFVAHCRLCVLVLVQLAVCLRSL